MSEELARRQLSTPFGGFKGVRPFPRNRARAIAAAWAYAASAAKLKQDSEELSLCFDPTAGSLGEFDTGEALFDDTGATTQTTKNILDFCEKFEEAGMRTKAFIEQLKQNDLLMDGEISIERNEMPGKPYVYRGFQMIDEAKLRALDGDALGRLHAAGHLMPIFMAIASLSQISGLVARKNRRMRHG